MWPSNFTCWASNSFKSNDSSTPGSRVAVIVRSPAGVGCDESSLRTPISSRSVTWTSLSLPERSSARKSL